MYGKAHDLAVLKQEIAKDCTFFEKLSIFADLGYQGVAAYFQNWAGNFIKSLVTAC